MEENIPITAPGGEGSRQLTREHVKSFFNEHRKLEAEIAFIQLRNREQKQKLLNLKKKNRRLLKELAELTTRERLLQAQLNNLGIKQAGSRKPKGKFIEDLPEYRDPGLLPIDGLSPRPKDNNDQVKGLKNSVNTESKGDTKEDLPENKEHNPPKKRTKSFWSRLEHILIRSTKKQDPLKHRDREVIPKGKGESFSLQNLSKTPSEQKINEQTKQKRTSKKLRKNPIR
ncbi:hypothetical protein SAMN05421766_1173 [Zobellia uliginosa]|uniref:Uncharacterized protein n=1 Tax=Zobellia uliginosa TaxID=143224 RepID=A0ABY1L2A8_9FLAO|nr:hypothetical protein [Zobellia uliginosa]SIT15982.1 hypothetical protein SAMN05421766_1173 [Zobellia uliginosa]